MKTTQNIQSVSQNKCCEEKHVDLSLKKAKGEGKRHYLLIKDSNTFMYV